MTKENTKSLLENIKKKMMNINAPKADNQSNFANLDDDFEYIVPKSGEPGKAQQKIEPKFNSLEQMDIDLSDQEKFQLPPIDKDTKDEMLKITLPDFFGLKEEPKLSDLSLAQDLKADFVAYEQKKTEDSIASKKFLADAAEKKEKDNIIQLNNAKEFNLDDLEDVGDEMDFDIDATKKLDKSQDFVDSKPAKAIDDDLDLDFDLDDEDGEEEDKQVPAKIEEDDDLDSVDLGDLKDDIDLDVKESQNKAPMEAALKVAENNLADEVSHDEADESDFSQEDADIKLDIDDKDLDLGEEEKDNQNSDQSPEIATDSDEQSEEQEDIELSLDDQQEEFADNNKDLATEEVNEHLDDLHNEEFEQLKKLESLESSKQPITDQNQTIKDSLLSKQTIEKTSNSIKKLMNNFDNKKPSTNAVTVEQMLMSMLRPQLEEWLNANLPALVEKVIREEISKIVPKN